MAYRFKTQTILALDGIFVLIICEYIQEENAEWFPVTLSTVWNSKFPLFRLIAIQTFRSQVYPAISFLAGGRRDGLILQVCS